MCFLILDKLKRCWQCFRPNGLSKLLVTPNKVTTQFMNYKQVSLTVDIFRYCSELPRRKDVLLYCLLNMKHLLTRLQVIPIVKKNMRQCALRHILTTFSVLYLSSDLSMCGRACHFKGIVWFKTLPLFLPW